jgi:hypothetical protein
MKIRISPVTLGAMGHVEVVGIIHGDVLFPAPKGLANVQTGLGDHDPIQVIISPLQSLAQAVAAEGTKHAAINMRLNQTGRFMPSQNPDRENVRGVKYLRWRVSAKVPHHFPTSPFLPRPGIIMPLIDPIFEFLIQFLTSSGDPDRYKPKNFLMAICVIPAKAGIQPVQNLLFNNLLVLKRFIQR